MLLEALLGKLAWRKSESINPASQRLATLWGSSTTISGATVDENTALNIPTVTGGFSLISNAIKLMPWFSYERVPDGKNLLEGHPVFRLLHRQPNPTTTPSRFKKMMIWWALSWGNGRAEIERNGRGEPVWMWLIHPSRCYTRREEDGTIVHEVYNDDGSVTTLLDENVLHTWGFSRDGLTGISVVGLIRESLGLEVSAEEYSARFYKNNAQPTVVLEHPKKLSPDAQDRLKKNWQTEFTDKGRLGTRVAEEDMKVKVLGVPQKDAQFIESRTFGIQQFCRVLNLPPHKLAEMSHSTFSNIEHQAIECVGDAYMPWAIDLEEEADRKLFTEAELAKGYFTEFLVDGLLRGDSKTRNEVFKTQRQQGVINANEWRRKENMNRQEGEQGDVYLVPLNMLPATEYTEENYKARTQQPEPPQPPPGEQVNPDEGDKQQAMAELRTKIAEAHMPVLADAIARMMKVAQNAKYRAPQEPEAHEKWREKFLPDHVIAYRGAIIPAIVALGGAVRATLPRVVLADVWEKLEADFTVKAAEQYRETVCQEVGLVDDVAGIAKLDAQRLIDDFVKQAMELNRWDGSKN